MQASPRTERRADLAFLDAGATRVLRRLDAVFEGWGVDAGAHSMIMPALLPVSALSNLDFYDNFPHQAMLASSLDLDSRRDGPTQTISEFSPSELLPAELALPSAACYAVYLHLAGGTVAGNTRYTVLGRCFRKEERYESLRRLMGFHMREIVAVGERDFAAAHLETFTGKVLSFADALGLKMRKEAATDPFYAKDGSRNLLAQLTPVKHEFIVDDLAIASVNTHRNFFGERCDITLADTGQQAYTSCVAFGLERWLAVLADRFIDWDTAIEAIIKAEEELNT